jgi:hypothetical protein
VIRVWFDSQCGHNHFVGPNENLTKSAQTPWIPLRLYGLHLDSLQSTWSPVGPVGDCKLLTPRQATSSASLIHPWHPHSFDLVWAQWVLHAHLSAHSRPCSHSPHSCSPVRSLMPLFAWACILTCTLVHAHLCLVHLCLCALLHPLVPFSLYTISNLIIIELTYLSWLWSGSLLLQWLVTCNFVLVSVAVTG